MGLRFRARDQTISVPDQSLVFFSTPILTLSGARFDKAGRTFHPKAAARSDVGARWHGQFAHLWVAFAGGCGQGAAAKGRENPVDFIIRSLVIGIGATALFDLWGLALHVVFGLPAPAWGMGGRWFSHVARGRVWHDDIGKATPVAGEAAIGWLGHYAVGVVYAAALLAIWGPEWAAAPTLAPALIVGVVTISAGSFLMSPGMGGGIASARAPNPWKSRGLGLAAHVVFGLGLYLSALAIKGL